tara:strand:+ start:2811 stop:3527 length:717 start_codon:yes stop_codon:yes gene_type:complete
MEKKKNSKADIGKNSSLYFAVGLALMVFLSYGAINYKVYESSDLDLDQLTGLETIDEDDVPPPPPPPEPEKPPPPPPPPPDVIEIIEDEEEIEETIIESTESDEELVIEDIEVEEVEEEVEVPFAVIENVPVFPGCERGNNEKKRKCMSEKIARFVQKKFNTDLAGDLGLTGRQRISVIFKIDKSGNVTGVRARAPHPRLEKEAQRVINLLPKMQPGKQRGKAVIVPYSLPIIFQVQD